MFGPCFVMQDLLSFKFLVLQSSAEAKRAVCFYFNNLPDVLTLFHCALGWYAVCDYGVTCSYLLFKKKKVVYKKSCSTEHEISTAHQN